MDKTKVAIIGLGGISQIAHLPLLSRMEEVEITAVCDIEKSKARNIAQKYGIKNFYSDYDAMLKETTADCVIVASPTNYHKEQVIKAFEQGLNVLVEKPFARTYDEGLEIMDTAKKSKKKFMVGMNNRFRPDLMMQESFISAGELGQIFYIKAGFLRKRSTVESWALRKEDSGGGVFMDLGIVLLDIAMWLMKFPKVVSVSAVNYNQAFKSVEDSSFAMVRFANNATVSIEASWTLLREDDLFYCNVYGTEGSSSINPLKIYKRMHGNLVNVTPLKLEKPANIFKRSFEYELRNFISSVRNDTEPVSNGNEALSRMHVVDAVYKSAKQGKEISFK